MWIFDKTSASRSYSGIARIAVLGMTLVLLGEELAAQRQAPPPPTPSQAELAEELASGPDEVREKALASILQIRPADRSVAVRRALVAELSRVQRFNQERARQVAAGAKLEPLPESDYLQDLLMAVIQLNDPLTAPQLASFVAYGRIVGRALLDFGDVGLDAILDVARSSDDSSAAEAALKVLNGVATSKRKEPLPATVRNRMLAAADRHLRRNQPRLLVIYEAASLAVALKDSTLISRVQVLATDKKAVLAMGVDANYVGWLQDKLRQLLKTVARTQS
jgi:hypothetical protein